MVILWGILLFAAAALCVLGLVSAVRTARANPDILRAFEDPETGTSADEWMTAIR